MNINELLKKKNIESNNDYSFLENDKETIDNLVFMTLSGSRAYGTNLPDSDIDVRCVKMNPKEDILLLNNKAVSTHVETDTSMYNINTIIKFFANANPNVLEFLGDTERNALYVHPYFKKMVLDNYKLFLSTYRVFKGFGGFMKSQVNKLNNKTNRDSEEIIIENLMRSLEKASLHIKEHYDIDIGIQKEDNLYFIPNGNKINLHINDLDLETCAPCLNEVATICKNAKDINQRTKKQRYIVDNDRVEKHILHYVRLSNMGCEILTTGEIHTYREKDHDLLMDIRLNEHNQWLKDDKPTDKCMKLIEQKEKELQEAAQKSILPEKVDWNKINAILKQVNYDIVTDNWKQYRYERG